MSSAEVPDDACRPCPAAALRPISPSSSAFHRRGHIALQGGTLYWGDGGHSGAVGLQEVRGVQHRYRIVVYGANMNPRKPKTVAGELVLLAKDGSVLASLPGGWVSHCDVQGASHVLPGWWRRDEFDSWLRGHGLLLSEVGIDEAAGYAYSPSCPFFMDRPLPPACYGYRGLLPLAVLILIIAGVGVLLDAVAALVSN